MIDAVFGSAGGRQDREHAVCVGMTLSNYTALRILAHISPISASSSAIRAVMRGRRPKRRMVTQLENRVCGRLLLSGRGNGTGLSHAPGVTVGLAAAGG